jgi:hypothetical protein
MYEVNKILNAPKFLDFQRFPPDPHSLVCLEEASQSTILFLAIAECPAMIYPPR